MNKGSRLVTLSDPAVQAMKVEWERTRNKCYKMKTTLTFDQLFLLFIQKDLSFSSIAKEANLSRERIRQIYNTYFLSIFKIDTKTRKMKVRVELKDKVQAIKIRQAEEALNLLEGSVKVVLSKAQQVGCTVKAIPQRRLNSNVLSGKVFRKRLLINDQTCSILFARTYFNPDGKYDNYYAHVHFSPVLLDSFKFLILHINIPSFPETFYVIPCDELLKRLVEKKLKKTINIYIPLKKVFVKNDSIYSFFETYKEAWHLLSQETSKPIST
mgnify:CR=1 FL=1